MALPNTHAVRKFLDMIECSVIRTLIHLAVFDYLPLAGEEPISLGELAHRVGSDSMFLARLLRVVVTSGLVSLDNSMYKNTVLSQEYRQACVSARFFVIMHDEGFLTLGALPSWVDQQQRPVEPGGLTGHTHNPHTYRAGCEGKSVFDILSKDPDRLERFQAGMASMDSLHPYIGFYDFTNILPDPDDADTWVRIVDIGGGDGYFLSIFLEEYRHVLPELTVLQDIPASIELAKRNRNLPYGVRLYRHDFFQPQPIIGAHVYHIRACLHDYSDELCRVILAHVAKAMTSKSTLVIAENVRPTVPQTGELIGCLDMVMMGVGGKIRTRDEFDCLLRSAGLRLHNLVKAPALTWAVIEARLARVPKA